MRELLDSLKKAHDTAVGPDDIHYQILKKLPEKSCSTYTMKSGVVVTSLSSGEKPSSSQSQKQEKISQILVIIVQ